MSRVRRIYEIEPHNLGSNNHDERELFRGITCPRCNGKGGFSKEVAKDQHKTIECPRCEGVGSLMAQLTVRWMPDFDLGNKLE